MTTVEPYTVDWRDQAACAGQDTDLWFSSNLSRARKVCGGCLVRAECLYDALQNETPSTAYGVRGGLTRRERRALPELPSAKADAIAMLRALPPPPEYDIPADERTDQSMTTPPADTAPPAADTALVTTSTLLRWAEDHADAEVQEQGARAEAALAGLRKRYAADQELTAITTEAERLEKRLAELRAREAALVPARPKSKRKPLDYPVAEVRAWAAANGIACPARGRIPKSVVDAWTEAQKTENTHA
ncbi:WhiB family transcriptional regulator [Streptomyces murinus]